MTEEVIKYETSKLEQLKKLHEELETMYEVKNKWYGDSFGKLFEEMGFIGAYTQIFHKFSRLKKHRFEMAPKSDELIDDLKDMSNYCLMTVIELERSKDEF